MRATLSQWGDSADGLWIRVITCSVKSSQHKGQNVRSFLLGPFLVWSVEV